MIEKKTERALANEWKRGEGVRWGVESTWEIDFFLLALTPFAFRSPFIHSSVFLSSFFFLSYLFFFTLLHASSALTKAKKKAGAVERAVVNAKTRLCKKKEEK